jgi:hypothetical protein
MRTSKDIVHAKYPDATARFHEAVFEAGHASPKWDAYWSIDTASGRVLGTGPIELAAWVNAESSVIDEYRKQMNGAFVIARHTLMDASDQGGEAKAAIFQTIRETIDRGKGAYVVKDDGGVSDLKFDEGGNLMSEPLETLWSRAADICEKEVALADSSRAHWGHPTPGRSEDKANAEHDEFLARSLVFDQIRRICRTMAPLAVAERIRELANNPGRTASGIKYQSAFADQWRAAYEYALDQCGIRRHV